MHSWESGQYLRFADEPSREELRFIERDRALLAEAFPARSDGKLLLPYPRLFFIATSR